MIQYKPMHERTLIFAVNDHGSAEAFYSIQGEGPEIGRPSLFLRLSGCNLHCEWCDTPYTWNWKNTSFSHQENQKYDKATEQIKLNSTAIEALLKKHDCPNLVITGGEPLVQQKALADILKDLKKAYGLTIDIESNATITPTVEFDALVDRYVLSPKLSNSAVPASKRLNTDTLEWFAQCSKASFKFVATNDQDLQEILKLIKIHHLPKERIYLMPMGVTESDINQHKNQVAAHCLEYGFNYSDRLHLRLFGAKRGV